jgi:methylmalonyl-CoA/ethylmalonyl-CoA epimerase
LELDHVGVAVANLEKALPRWRTILGAPTREPEEVPTQHVRVVFLEGGKPPIELIEPTDPQSPVTRFLATRGEGVHHLAFSVPNVDRALDDLVRRGERVVDRTGRSGSRGRRVGFAHPSAFGGVLVEFVEAPP